MRRFMVIERFDPANVDAIYRRFAERGRMLPAGLMFIESWLTLSQDCVFQLMETDDPALFEVWKPNWDDLVDFEIIELGNKPVPAAGEARR